MRFYVVDSLTHKFYLEKDGLEITLSTINESISPEKAIESAYIHNTNFRSFYCWL